MGFHVKNQPSEGDLPREFLATADAFLAGAEQLTRLMNSEAWPSDFYRGQVAKFLAFHAIELFLKACILHVAPTSSINKHSIPELHAQFRGHFPGISLELPFQVEALPPYPELVKKAAQTNRQFHELLKYPADTSGKAWPGARGIWTERFEHTLSTLRSDLERVASGIFADG